ncbi:type-F conjugative transfer system protein TrbI [Sphingobium sp. H39-3-25]|uniref:type-F conjugative transfer system protein TrbI n=1 Tax=Sphingobium arseniciresistens TaxID=3030834 RepID=UPI0023B9C87D|nr:type-F conjugative transfer system protein TrbI [Sphingobium arseniciresistens]
MAEQPELDLPAPLAAPQEPATAPRRIYFAGYSRMQILGGLALLLAAVWGMWVTKTLVTPKQDHIVSARLSSIVGEYVQAQARSASPPAQVEAEMRTFMASLDKELQRRSAGGQIVLVGEAVLTKNVPDITDSLKSAVYASGVPRPRQASAEELQQLEQQAMAAAQPQIIPQAQIAGQMPGVSAPIDPMMAAQAMQTGPVQQQAAPQYALPAPQVSTFGGPDGNGGQ